MEKIFANKEDCCGCELCANECPKGVIEMTEDGAGFFYSQIVNPQLCVNCGKCQRVCPIKNYTSVDSKFIKYYAGSFVDDNDTVSCASGGLATAISRGFIKNGGVVYGVGYSDDFQSIQYMRAINDKQIERLKTSKYAQSRKNSVYQDIKNDLKLQRSVLFVGLPCDVAAVKRLCENDKSLYTIELICHGPTSQSVHRQFLEEERKTDSTITEFSTRWKLNGNWKPFYIRIKTENGEEILEPFHKSSYGAAFRYLKRPSCYSCKIKGTNLAGDIMIGDYHYVEAGMKAYNKHGVSSALVHNTRGQELLNMIDDSFILVEINARGALANGAITKAIVRPKHQAKFEATFVNKGLKAANKMWIVRESNLQRTTLETIMKYGVKIKRILKPSSRPKYE